MEPSPELVVVPSHIGIIMDGNGRWAQAQGLPRDAGHRAGVENIKPIVEYCAAAGIGALSLFAFSTENWDRPAAEVRGLLILLEVEIRRRLDELDRMGAQIRHSGRLDIAPRLQKEIRRAVRQTAGNDRIVLNVAFNYGGRDEIIQVARQLIQSQLSPFEVTEDTFRQHLYQPDLPDLDMVIRTGGERRLSNFMLWQAAYAEYFWTDTFWPAFGPAQLEEALLEFSRRERRFGQVRKN